MTVTSCLFVEGHRFDSHTLSPMILVSVPIPSINSDHLWPRGITWLVPDPLAKLACVIFAMSFPGARSLRKVKMSASA